MAELKPRRIRLLFLSRTYPPKTGGMETYLQALKESLENISDLRSVIISLNKYVVIPALPIFFLFAFLKVMRWKPNAVYCGDILLGPVGTIISKIYRIPSIVTIYGLDMTYSNPIYKGFISHSISNFSRFIAISDSTKSISEQHGIDSERIRVIRPGAALRFRNLESVEFSTRIMNPIPKRGFLLTVGRLIERKGVAWFINEVLPNLFREGYRLNYVIVGDGPEANRIAQHINSSRYSNYIHLLGWVDDCTLAALYKNASAFIMPNIRVKHDFEGFGLVLVEAAMCGLPSVAARLQGISDAVVEGKTGLFAEPENSREFLLKIKEILSPKWQSEENRNQIAKVAKERFSWRQVAEDYIQTIREIRA